MQKICVSVVSLDNLTENGFCVMVVFDDEDKMKLKEFVEKENKDET